MSAPSPSVLAHAVLESACFASRGHQLLLSSGTDYTVTTRTGWHGPWETMHIEPSRTDDGCNEWAIKMWHGGHLAACPNGTVEANRPTKTDATQFAVKIDAAGCVTLQSRYGTYLRVAESGGRVDCHGVAGEHGTLWRVVESTFTEASASCAACQSHARARPSPPQ